MLLACSGSNVAGVWSAKNQALGETFVLATWTVPPRSRVLISFLSMANGRAARNAGSAIGQPVPRSWTTGLREQPPVSSAASNGPGDQFGRRNSYRSAGMALVLAVRPWASSFGMSESWRSVAKSTSPAAKPAIMASASPYHLKIRVSRWAGWPVDKLL